jgi:hypothetical protein
MKQELVFFLKEAMVFGGMRLPEAYSLVYLLLTIGISATVHS